MTRRSILRVAALGAGTRYGLASAADQHDLAARIFSQINQLRQQNGAESLEWSTALADCARQQSVRKAQLRFPGHDDPERGGIAERLHTAGICWARCAENMFMEKGWDDPVNFAVVFWWYSPGHQENLLNPAFTNTGVGLAQGEDEAWFVTQIFLESPPRASAQHTHGLSAGKRTSYIIAPADK